MLRWLSSSEHRRVYTMFIGRSLRGAIWRLMVYGTAGILAAPIVYLLLSSIWRPSEYLDHIVRLLLPRYVGNTLLMVITVCCCTGVVGTLAAWLVARYDFPLRRVLEWALVLPLAVPSYIAAFTYTGLFDYAGPLQRLFRHLLGRAPGDYPALDFGGMGGLIFIMTFTLYPYIYVVMRGAFQQQAAQIFEAAQILRGRRSLLTRVALPMARPALVGCLGLVMMESINEYGAPFYLGVDTFTTGIIYTWSSLYDIPSAVQLAAMLLLFVIIVFGIERSVRGRAHFDNGNSPLRIEAPTSVRGVFGYGISIVCALPVVAGFLVPAGMLLSWALRGIGPLVVGHGRELLAAGGNSLLLVAVAALLCTAIASILAYGPRVGYSRFDERIARIGVVGYSIPGAVVGLSVLVAIGYNSLLPGKLLLTHTALALIYAYILRYVAVSYYPIQSGLSQTCSCYDDVARSLGSTPLRTLTMVNLPIISKTVVGAAMLVAIDVLKDLPLTVMLRPFNFDTLALQAFRLANDERLVAASPPALLILTGGVILLLLIYRPLMRQIVK